MERGKERGTETKVASREFDSGEASFRERKKEKEKKRQKEGQIEKSLILQITYRYDVLASIAFHEKYRLNSTL